MRVALIQHDLHWENPAANREAFAEKIMQCSDCDLIVLPEMFTTGFTMNPTAVAEAADGVSVRWMLELARLTNAAITGSLSTAAESGFYNRMYFVCPDGTIFHYDKRHLFTLAGENDVYCAGTRKVVVPFRGWKICLQVCYDLRFPVFARNQEEYDLLLYVANWPDKRLKAWDILLPARAVENMCFVAGVNRTGNDPNGNTYKGHSQLVNFMGEYVILPAENEGIFKAEIHLEEMRAARRKLGFLNDRDSFKVI